MLSAGQVFPSETFELHSGCGPVYVTLVYDAPRENILDLQIAGRFKAGGCVSAHLSALQNLIATQFLEKNFTKRYSAYMFLTGQRCQNSDPYFNTCCIELIVRQILKVEDELYEIRKEKEDA